MNSADIRGATVSHSAELVRGDFLWLESKAPSSALRAPSPQGEKVCCGLRWASPTDRKTHRDGTCLSLFSLWLTQFRSVVPPDAALDSRIKVVQVIKHSVDQPRRILQSTRHAQFRQLRNSMEPMQWIETCDKNSIPDSGPVGMRVSGRPIIEPVVVVLCLDQA
jgi:hypothetical protein